MSYQNDGVLTFTASTGLAQYQLVALSTARKLIHPTAGGAGTVIGVLISSGTTASTAQDGTYQSVAVNRGSVVTVKCGTASTGLNAGGAVTCTSRGRICPSTAGDAVVGILLESVGSTLHQVPFLFTDHGTT